MRSLSVSGAIAAGVIGCAALSSSWGMGFYLIAWFVLATVLSKIGKQQKAARVSGVIEKGSQRDAWQVLANGGVFCACAVMVAVGTRAGFEGGGTALLFMVAGAGSLAASGADTWATEIGTLYGGAPLSLRTFSRVPAGTSGAVTLAGTLAMIAGAIVLASLAYAFALTPRMNDAPRDQTIGIVAMVAVAGIAGALADTFIGAWFQERRWCPRCTGETEQLVHNCGTTTVHHRGVARLDNDVVNAVCSLIGAVTPFIALLILTLIGGRGDN